MALFSFLNRKRTQDNKDLGSPLANSYYDAINPQMSRASSSQLNSARQTSSQPNQSYASAADLQRARSYQPPAPKPQQKTTQPTYQQPTLQERQMNQMGQRALDRTSQIQQQAQRAQELQKQLSDRRMQTLGDIGNIQRESFGQYADQLRQGLGIQRGTTERQIKQAQQAYDDQRYQNERSRQERMKGLENTLAGLGTLQSSSLMNVGARINQGAERQDRSSQRDLNARVADLQDQYRLAENQTEGLIQQEASRYRQQAAQLSEAMDTNSIEYQQAIEGLRAQADANINAILDSFDEFSYNTQLQMQQAQLAGQDQVSEEFLATGMPQNRADLLWMAENSDSYDDMTNRMYGNPQEVSEASQVSREIDQILNYGSLGPITGRVRLGQFYRNDSNDLMAAIDSIKAKMQLADAGKLKGQGQISEGERAILRDAATKLRYNMSEEAFRSELSRIKGVFDRISGNPVAGGQDYQSVNQSLVQQFGG